jgi:hypothetical protein
MRPRAVGATGSHDEPVCAQRLAITPKATTPKQQTGSVAVAAYSFFRSLLSESAPSRSRRVSSFMSLRTPCELRPVDSSKRPYLSVASLLADGAVCVSSAAVKARFLLLISPKSFRA